LSPPVILEVTLKTIQITVTATAEVPDHWILEDRLTHQSRQLSAYGFEIGFDLSLVFDEVNVPAELQAEADHMMRNLEYSLDDGYTVLADAGEANAN
jgi:hypothetical protein